MIVDQAIADVTDYAPTEPEARARALLAWLTRDKA